MPISRYSPESAGAMAYAALAAELRRRDGRLTEGTNALDEMRVAS
jgi:hypothetical protein